MEMNELFEKENHILPFFWVRGEAESVIRKEIEKVQQCGINEICVEGRPFEDFAGPAWWKELDIILDECRRRNMRIWILDDRHFPTGYANGLIEKKYPERRKEYINYNSLDVSGKSRKLTIDVSDMLLPCTGWWELGRAADTGERERNRLLAIIAVKLAEGNVLFEETVDLTDAYDGKYAEFYVPNGNWRIMVFYKTRTDGGDPAYINMLDRVSAHSQIEAVYEPHFVRYPDEFGKTIAGFFSDEPQIGNISEIAFDAKLGRKRMPLPWSHEMQEAFEEKYGREYKRVLPYLYFDTKEKNRGVQARYYYMDTVSELYKKNFSNVLGAWCEAHHVEYIGHVVEDNNLHSRLGMGAGHYFRAMSGQHMSGVDTIGNQIVFGAPDTERNALIPADGGFFHYTLCKMGASCAHLDPKKKGRALCELFGAYGWSFGVRDMKHVLDHVLVRGINRLVPHALSMAEYPDPDCPPHFYAGGHNPEFPAFAELMKYGERMCRLLSGGKHIATALVLYDAEGDWTGGGFMPMQKVCRELVEHQIDFDIVSLDILTGLDKYNGRTDKDRIIVNGECFNCLIVPYIEHAPETLVRFLRDSGDLPVLFVDGKPNDVIGESVEDAGQLPGEIVKLDALGMRLREREMYDISVNVGFSELSFLHYYKNRNIYLFYNESAEKRFEGTLELKGTEGFVTYDALNDRLRTIPFETDHGITQVHLCLEAGESIVLIEKTGLESSHRKHRSFKEVCCLGNKVDISAGWDVSMAKAAEDPLFGKKEHIKTLYPVSDRYRDFSGIIRYETEFELPEIPEEAFLYAENINEVMRVWINGGQAVTVLAPPYIADISGQVKKGKNAVIIEVMTTCARDQLNYTKGPVRTSFEALEPSGMFGKVAVTWN